MRRQMIALMVSALIVAVTPTATADEGGGTYLALGDSVAAGTQQPALFTADGYTNRLFRHLQDVYGFDEDVNLACPGEDTAEMIASSGGPTSDGSLCYGPDAVLPPGGTSQLDRAVGYLLANPGEVELITIAIGANDVLVCDPSSVPPGELPACVEAQLGQIAANLPVIVATLQAVAPGVPIVAMNYYQPNLAFWITGPEGQAVANLSLALTPLFNGTLQAVYGAFGVPVADMATAFGTFATDGGDPPTNVRRVCQLTLMCEKDGEEEKFVLSPQPDIHPSDKGYKTIGSTHAELIDALGILG